MPRSKIGLPLAGSSRTSPISSTLTSIELRLSVVHCRSDLLIA